MRGFLEQQEVRCRRRQHGRARRIGLRRHDESRRWSCGRLGWFHWYRWRPRLRCSRPGGCPHAPRSALVHSRPGRPVPPGHRAALARKPGRPDRGTNHVLARTRFHHLGPNHALPTQLDLVGHSLRRTEHRPHCRGRGSKHRAIPDLHGGPLRHHGQYRRQLLGSRARPCPGCAESVSPLPPARTSTGRSERQRRTLRGRPEDHGRQHPDNQGCRLRYRPFRGHRSEHGLLVAPARRHPVRHSHPIERFDLGQLRPQHDPGAFPDRARCPARIPSPGGARPSDLDRSAAAPIPAQPYHERQRQGRCPVHHDPCQALAPSHWHRHRWAPDDCRRTRPRCNHQLAFLPAVHHGRPDRPALLHRGPSQRGWDVQPSRRSGGPLLHCGHAARRFTPAHRHHRPGHHPYGSLDGGAGFGFPVGHPACGRSTADGDAARRPSTRGSDRGSPRIHHRQLL